MKSFALRSIYLTVLVTILWIASVYVRSIVDDRLTNREQARQSVRQSFPGQQTVAGPFLSIVYAEKYTLEVDEGTEAKPKKVNKQFTKIHTHYVLPDQLNINNQMETKPRSRGIFKVNTFHSKVKLDGNWVLPLVKDLPRSYSTSTLILPQIATVYVGVDDARGLSALTATLATNEVRPEPNIKRVGDLPSVQFSLPINLEVVKSDATKAIPFDINFELAGTDSIQYVPLARENKVRLVSDWPHASYEGAALPSQKESDAKGFSALWNVSSLSSEAPSLWLQRLAITTPNSAATDAAGSVTKTTDSSSSNNAMDFSIHKASTAAGHAIAAASRAAMGLNSDQHIRQSGLNSFGVRLIDPVDVYTLSDRATKYAMLFILLTLGGFVLFELFKKLRIHPLQYLLVGVALLMFFLLLISLSEHFGFDRAYLSASVACTGLISFYAAYLLNSWKRALPLGIGLTLLYGSLYQILQSEDKALLMGSLLLFFILAVLMIGTRNTNWYQLLELKKDGTKPIKENAEY